MTLGRKPARDPAETEDALGRRLEGDPVAEELRRWSTLLERVVRVLLVAAVVALGVLAGMARCGAL